MNTEKWKQFRANYKCAASQSDLKTKILLHGKVKCDDNNIYVYIIKRNRKNPHRIFMLCSYENAFFFQLNHSTPLASVQANEQMDEQNISRKLQLFSW